MDTDTLSTLYADDATLAVSPFDMSDGEIMYFYLVTVLEIQTEGIAGLDDDL